MNRDGDKMHVFYQRWLVLIGIFAAITSIIVARLFFLQVLDADRYRHMAEENRLSIRMIGAPRGIIYDETGEVLAENKQVFRVLLTVEQSTGLDGTLELINRFVPLTETDYARIRKEARRKKAFMPITVADNITWDQVQALQLASADLPGVTIDEGLSRVYPWPRETAHVVGYVAPLDDADVKRIGDKALEVPNYRVGKLGLESFYDGILQGVPGEHRVEVNSSGRVIRELESSTPVSGSPLTLTLNLALQKYIVERLGEEGAAAVVLDVHTGGVIGMVSTPAFDPNEFNMGISGKEWLKLSTNEDAPLINKAISGQYSPGSTFKMVVALAALEGGVVNENTSVHCPGYLDLGNKRLHCWKHGGHGNISLVHAIAESCDVYFYEIARRTGIDRIADMAYRFGFGKTHTLELAQEKPGHVPTRSWKEGRYGVSWQLGETMVVGIGQSYLLTTPLQLALYAAMIANDGKPLRPRFVKDHDYPAPAVSDLKLPAAYWRLIKEGMFGVINKPFGTAISSSLGIPGIQMSGKTGTTQVRSVSLKERQAGYDARKVQRKERPHALFVGYAPSEEPRYAIAVIVEHGVGGAATAAPMARDIMRELFRIKAEQAEKEKADGH